MNEAELANLTDVAINKPPFGQVTTTVRSLADEMNVQSQESQTLVRCRRCWAEVGTLADTEPGALCEMCA